MVKIGDIIGGYRLVAELGGGGFATVYTGKHIIFKDRPIVAIKVLHPHLISPEQYDQFIQEAQLLERLKHPHILPIKEAGIHENSLYLIVEYAENGSLRQHLQRQDTKPLPIDEATRILSQIGDALHYAHEQNVTHCDLKPENILFNAQGDALLADFGIAVVLASGKTEDVGRRGTLYYMAPEQFSEKVSKKSDQYALGCIAYELFTGRRPFDVPNPTLEVMWYQHAKVEPVPPKQLNPDLPVHIEQAILKAMAKDRDMRQSDVKAFITALHKTKEQWLDESETLLEAKDYEKALAACEQAMQLDPYDARAYHCKGKVFYVLKRYEEALADYERAIQRGPDNASVYNDKGDALRELKRYEEALVAYERVIQLNPNNGRAYLGKGDVQYARKYRYEALASYEWAIQLEAKFALAFRKKGLTLRVLGDYKKALASFEEAIQLDPNDPLAYRGKGKTLRFLKRYEEAFAAFEDALRLDPNNADTYVDKGKFLRERERYEEALVAFEKAIQLDSNNVAAYQSRANILEVLGRYQDAMKMYEQIIELNPSDADAYGNRGRMLFLLRRYQESLAAFEQIIKLNPNSALAHHNRGVVLYYLDRPEESQQAHEKARQLGYKE